MRFFTCVTVFLICLVANSQDLPLGYSSYFRDDFSTKKINKSIVYSSHSDIKQVKGVLVLKEKVDTTNNFSPSASFVIDNNVFGDFVAKVRLKTKTIDSDSLNNFYILAALKDSSNYYLTELNSGGIYYNQVYRGVNSNIMSDSGLAIKDNSWVELKIERDILQRTLTLSCQDWKSVFTDPNFIMGYLGFGIKGKILFIDKLEIWAPTSIAKPSPVFR